MKNISVSKYIRSDIFIIIIFLFIVFLAQSFIGSSLVALSLKILTTGVLSYLFVKQFQQSVGPEDGYTRLRWRIFMLICLITIFLIPSIWLQIMNYLNLDTGQLDQFVTVTTNLSIFGFVMLVFTTVKYKPNKEQNNE